MYHPFATAVAVLTLHCTLLNAADLPQQIQEMEDFHFAAQTSARQPLEKADEGYRAKLEKFKQGAKAAGDIKSWDAADEAVRNLDGGGLLIPSNDPGVAAIQKEYSIQRKKADAVIGAALSKADREHLDALRKLVKESTKKGDFDLARAAQARADEFEDHMKPRKPVAGNVPMAAPNSGSEDLEFWKNKMLEDFPAMRDPKSKMMTKFLGLKKDKESLAPSFFKNANWTYQLAWDTALAMNDANPKYVDPKTPLFRGRFYKVILEKCKWHEADARCRAMNGRMVTISDQETQDFVAKLAGGKYLWLGVTDEIQEGKWIWSDGGEMTFRNFGNGEGNGNHGSDEDYLFIFNDGKWGDGSSNGVLEGFICEWWKANDGDSNEKVPSDPNAKWMSLALALCGEWQAENDSSNHYFIYPDKTVSHWRDRGIWRIERGTMKVAWDNGHSADVKLEGQSDSMDWIGFSPGGRNRTVLKMTRVR